MNNAQRQYLRRRAHDLRPTVQIGKQGVTPQLMATVGNELEAHELIKVKFLDFQDEKRELAEQIAAQNGAALVALIGNVAILYRQQPDPEKRKLSLPGAW